MLADAMTHSHRPRLDRELQLAASARAIIASRLRVVNADRTPFDIAPIELFDRGVSSFVGCHLYKAEAARSVGRTIHDDLRTIDLARLRESILQILIRNRPSQITNVQSSTHYRLPSHNANICPMRKAASSGNCPK